MRLLPLLILMTSCATYDYAQTEYWPTDLYASGSCSYFGVRELHQPMGEVVEARGVVQSDLDILCAGVMMDESRYLGCALADEHGKVSLYWLAGYQLVERHERCHAIHGVEHNGVRI